MIIKYPVLRLSARSAKIGVLRRSAIFLRRSEKNSHFCVENIAVQIFARKKAGQPGPGLVFHYFLNVLIKMISMITMNNIMNTAIAAKNHSGAL